MRELREGIYKTYKYIRTPGEGVVRAHKILAEKTLGHPLPEGAVIHHANGGLDGPIVICQDSAYHKILHWRMEALKACGNATWKKCHFCHVYEDPKNMVRSVWHKRNQTKYYHRECENAYQRKKYKAKRR